MWRLRCGAQARRVLDFEFWVLGWGGVEVWSWKGGWRGAVGGTSCGGGARWAVEINRHGTNNESEEPRIQSRTGEWCDPEKSHAAETGVAEYTESEQGVGRTARAEAEAESEGAASEQARRGEGRPEEQA